MQGAKLRWVDGSAFIAGPNGRSVAEECHGIDPDDDRLLTVKAHVGKGKELSFDLYYADGHGLGELIQSSRDASRLKQHAGHLFAAGATPKQVAAAKSAEEPVGNGIASPWLTY